MLNEVSQIVLKIDIVFVMGASGGASADAPLNKEGGAHRELMTRCFLAMESGWKTTCARRCACGEDAATVSEWWLTACA